MLIAKTFQAIMRDALGKADRLTKERQAIRQFEELCAVLRQQGSRFTESLDPEVDEITYFIQPDNHGDYLAIIEAMSGMGADHLLTGGDRDLINPQPDAPAFWLTTPKGRHDGPRL
jgi:hypothetical protein